MSLNYYYNFAIIDRASKMCIEIRTNTVDNSADTDEYTLYLRVPTYSDDYLLKYYDENTGKWYYDEEMTSEWIPPEA